MVLEEVWGVFDDVVKVLNLQILEKVLEEVLWVLEDFVVVDREVLVFFK